MRKLFVAVLITTVAGVLATQAFAAARSVKIGDDFFVRKGSVPTITVRTGTRVTWRWTGKDLHNLAVTSGPARFRSGFKTAGTFSRTVGRAGTYSIVCTVHPGMKMKLRVTR